ncbi:hypothetical protein V6N13_047553 [Hibiscus sabdariffa]
MVKASSDTEGATVMMVVFSFGRSLVRGLSEARVGSRCDDEGRLGVVMDVGFGNGSGEGEAVFGYENWCDALDGGIKCGSSIWELDSRISSWVRVRWRLEVSSMKMMKVMENGLI